MSAVDSPLQAVAGDHPSRGFRSNATLPGDTEVDRGGRLVAESLPPTLDGRATAELFGCSYWSLLEQVKRGDCPVMPLRLGKRYRWPTALVLEAVGLGGVR